MATSRRRPTNQSVYRLSFAFPPLFPSNFFSPLLPLFTPNLICVRPPFGALCSALLRTDSMRSFAGPTTALLFPRNSQTAHLVCSFLRSAFWYSTAFFLSWPLFICITHTPPHLGLPGLFLCGPLNLCGGVALSLYLLRAHQSALGDFWLHLMSTPSRTHIGARAGVGEAAATSQLPTPAASARISTLAFFPGMLLSLIHSFVPRFSARSFSFSSIFSSPFAMFECPHSPLAS